MAIELGDEELGQHLQTQAPRRAAKSEVLGGRCPLSFWTVPAEPLDDQPYSRPVFVARGHFTRLSALSKSCTSDGRLSVNREHEVFVIPVRASLISMCAVTRYPTCVVYIWSIAIFFLSLNHILIMNLC